MKEGEAMREKMRVLVVDDDAGMCETLSAILEIKGYCVETAGDGHQAVQKARMSHFDFVLMDIKMPKLNGAEAYRIMKAENPDLGIALMTAYARDALVHDLQKDGTVKIIFKPFDVNEVFDLLVSAERTMGRRG